MATFAVEADIYAPNGQILADDPINLLGSGKSSNTLRALHAMRFSSMRLVVTITGLLDTGRLQRTVARRRHKGLALLSNTTC